MGHHHSGQDFLAALPLAFRQEVEASASNIMRRITPANAARLEHLAGLAAEEALHAHSQRRAETAYALAAELKRRARLLRH